MADKTENTKEFNSKDQERLILVNLSESKKKKLENRRKGEEVNKKEAVPETSKKTEAPESTMKNLEKRARELGLAGDETRIKEVDGLKAELKLVKEELRIVKEKLEKEQRKNETMKEDSKNLNKRWLEQRLI